MDYFSLSKEEREELTISFSQWIDNFLSDIGISFDLPVFKDKDKEYTVKDYTETIKHVFAFISPCREKILEAYEKNGKDAVLEVIKTTAPLVLSI